MQFLLIAIILLLASIMPSAQQFRFGNTQGDYMVLQQKPYHAQIWGFSSAGDTITITLSYQSNSQVIDTVTAHTASNSTWKAYLSPQPAKNDVEYIVKATSKSTSKTISLSHIVFGDVFWCSGQSNMGFCVDNAFNATAEVAAANNFPNIRVFKVRPSASNTPKIESTVYVPWSKANSSTIGNGNWTYFSAACWFFGRDLYESINYPIGLMEGDDGGNPIRVFMSDEARALCNETAENCAVINETTTSDTYSFDNNVGDVYDSGLWNGMIYPLLQTTIRGAIWYQGERDSKEECAPLYACAMPAMINSWRENWSAKSDTNATFPFGLVQLSTWNDNTQNETCSSPNQNNNFDCVAPAIVRWGQSANFGYLPNKIMPNTFMAGAIDLGD
eukprot:427389_1